MSRTVLFPVGPAPGWEAKEKSFNPDGLPCHSVVDSLVLLQSLRQSRARWLNAFPMLPPTKGRVPKQADPSKARDYYLENYGHFQMCVGPHIFSHTQLLEVRYKSDQPAPTLSLYPSSSSGHTDQTTSSFSAANPSMSRHLVQAVNDVSLRDPVFKTLLDKAINGLSNSEEYDDFVARVSTINANMPPPPSPPWDIAIQFDELPGTQKHVLPKGSVKLDKSHLMPGGTCHDVSITIPMPLSKESEGVPPPVPNTPGAGTASSNDTKSPQMVTLQWKGVTQTAYELLSRWSTDIKGVASTHKFVGDLGYLPHRLPDSELLAAIQSVLNVYPMRSIKPANADRVKRRPSQRKPAAEKSRSTKANAVVAAAASTAPAPPQPSPPPAESSQTPQSPPLPPPPPAITFAPVTFAPTPTVSAAPPKASPAVSTFAFVESDRPIIKRRKYTRRNSTAASASTIACQSCRQTGVPLMYGGRYCRECINSGRAPVGVTGATAASTSMFPPAYADPSARYGTTMTPLQTPPIYPPTTPVYHHPTYPALPEAQFRHWTPGPNPP